MSISNYIVPVMVILILGIAFFTKTDIFDSFCKGAKEGLNTTVDILPALICLMTCIGLLRTSGFTYIRTGFLSPITSLLNFPDECTPLVLIRPLSGSGALAVFEDVLKNNGPDSLPGLIASTLMGSSETTFYTVAVYFGAVKIKKTRHTIPSALSGDLTAFLTASFVVGILCL